MVGVAIRIADPGETPLSLEEQEIAEHLRIHPPRRYAQRFMWRKPWPSATTPERKPKMEPLNETGPRGETWL